MSSRREFGGGQLVSRPKWKPVAADESPPAVALPDVGESAVDCAVAFFALGKSLMAAERAAVLREALSL
jgi:hypothetical protein